MSQKKLIDLYTDEDFEEIVRKASSVHNIGVLLGYSKGTDVRKIVKERCERQGIDISELIQRGYDRTNKSNKKLSPEVIFIENSTVSQSTLRKHYLKEEYTEYKCSICGQEPIWQGKELTLTLDHINGNNKDNRLENLRWVCPNCDRQLPTFCSRNMNYANRLYKKEINYCIDCGEIISEGATRCLECNSIYERKVNRPDKDTLFAKLVELNGNFVQTGKLYGVTDNAIRKWCKKYGIPSSTKDYKNKKEKHQEFQYKVQQIDMKTGEILNTYDSCAEAERKLGIYHVNEASNPNNPRKSAGGFYWKRIETISLTK